MKKFIEFKRSIGFDIFSCLVGICIGILCITSLSPILMIIGLIIIADDVTDLYDIYLDFKKYEKEDEEEKEDT